MGIEPTLPAWKAGTLPLSYTRRAGRAREGRLPRFRFKSRCRLPRGRRGVRDVAVGEWVEQDSNLRRRCHQIYSLAPLATWVSTRQVFGGDPQTRGPRWLPAATTPRLRAGGESRTHNRRFTKPELCRLSYASVRRTVKFPNIPPRSRVARGFPTLDRESATPRAISPGGNTTASGGRRQDGRSGAVRRWPTARRLAQGGILPRPFPLRQGAALGFPRLALLTRPGCGGFADVGPIATRAGCGVNR